MPRLTSRDALERLSRQISTQKANQPSSVTVCSGTGCLAAKSWACAEAFASELARRELNGQVELRRTGCYGLCERGPVVVVQPANQSDHGTTTALAGHPHPAASNGICYLEVKREDVADIVERTVLKGQTVERLLYGDEGTRVTSLDEIPFYKHQQRLLLHANTLIDPKSIDDYIAIGGYSALAKALFEMSPERVLDEVKRSQLRGRGGGGFPTGVKWETTRNAPGDTKYVVVNADEGDPGAYMDRSLLEGNPHSIIEGLMIGAYAIGAKKGFIYVREEYPLAVENTEIALRAAREYGLLGENILGSGFSFDVAIHRGAGAFVSGESSALMTAIEGRAGRPRSKYIRTSVSGLWEKPTDLNNVETWANVPLIISCGADWFCKIGSEHSKGTKVFSLVGKVKHTGLVEVAMGVTLRKIIFDIGGGVPNGRKFKAVQTGGPSGGFLPESLLDLPVDFDELTRNGSMMGSGGMIVMDEDSCMVDAARYYVDFLAHESCGQCVPCREGLRQSLKILNRICAGEGRVGDIELLEELCDLLENASLCALGTSAPNPVRSALRHFRSEFEAHIREKRCPARVCMPLIHYSIDTERCDGCHLCVQECPANAIVGRPKQLHTVVQDKCIKCGNCVKICNKRLAVHKEAGAAVRVAAGG